LTGRCLMTLSSKNKKRESAEVILAGNFSVDAKKVALARIFESDYIGNFSCISKVTLDDLKKFPKIFCSYAIFKDFEEDLKIMSQIVGKRKREVTVLLVADNATVSEAEINVASWAKWLYYCQEIRGIIAAKHAACLKHAHAGE